MSNSRLLLRRIAPSVFGSCIVVTAVVVGFDGCGGIAVIDGDGVGASAKDGSVVDAASDAATGHGGSGGFPAADATTGCVVQVASGYMHNCARLSDGALWCWGSNSNGQLGHGNSSGGSMSPQHVAALGFEVAGIAAGERHTCVIKTDGTLWCFGENNSGQLGVGTSSWAEATPLQVTSLGTDVAEVELGRTHSCARKDDGSMWCWGQNDRGQIGVGNTEWQPLPAQVTQLANNVVDIGAGFEHSCALKTDGSIWCWGSNQAWCSSERLATSHPRPSWDRQTWMDGRICMLWVVPWTGSLVS